MAEAITTSSQEASYGHIEIYIQRSYLHRRKNPRNEPRPGTALPPAARYPPPGPGLGGISPGAGRPAGDEMHHRAAQLAAAGWHLGPVSHPGYQREAALYLHRGSH